jgi:SAM-dependent methyltransferase
MNTDLRRHSAPAERNGPPILAELQRLLPAQGLMLEVASGTGQHAALLGAGLPGWQWQPTDVDAAALPSIRAWCAGLARVRPPIVLDVLAQPWPAALPPEVDAMFCANMIHIAPWACTAALMQGAARRLTPHGLLITYGPYLEAGVPTSPGNLAFDADLRGRNPAWGLRELSAVAAEAAAAGLRLRERVAMPANNLLLAWSRAEG